MIASSLFIVNAANPMLIRSRKQMMYSKKRKGSIRVRTFRIVLASMASVRVSISLLIISLA